MFDSGIKATKFIQDIMNEDDGNCDIDIGFGYMFYSRLITLLYTDFIKLQGEFTVNNPVSPVEIDFIPYDCEPVRFCDIVKIYAVDDNDDIHELEPCVISDSVAFMKNCYYETFEGIAFKTNFIVKSIKVIFNCVPENLYKKYCSDNSYQNLNIPLPMEFLPLVSSYLRCEKYRFENSDSLCAKWAENYNSHLKDFKNWVDFRRNKNKVNSEAEI